MRFDVNIDFVGSFDVYDESEAQELAKRLAARFEIEAEWVASSAITSPAPLAVVSGVTRVDDGTRG